MPEKKNPPRGYITVNVPKDREPHLMEGLELLEVQKGLAVSKKEMRPSSLGVWIIDQWLIDNTSFRFEYFNSLEKHITIKDKKLPNLWIDIAIKPLGESYFELWCPECDSVDCVHIKFVVEKYPDKIKTVEEKGNWKYKE